MHMALGTRSKTESRRDGSEVGAKRNRALVTVLLVYVTVTPDCQSQTHLLLLRSETFSMVTGALGRKAPIECMISFLPSLWRCFSPDRAGKVRAPAMRC